ncbi:MAG: cytochrome c peroxidase [Bacteroidota bacterium]
MSQSGLGFIDLLFLPDYAIQSVPNYITKDNTTAGNEITDAGATLGRVLFYDKNLSVNNTVSCASCHKQEFAFGDTTLVSQGVNGVTGRHGMRLVNARFADEIHFFWDERAATLEEQTTQPIQDHAEMGFSGQAGDPGLDSLINKMSALSYYQELFTFVYGDATITEQRMQLAMAQFIRSMHSFDSRFDTGLEMVNNINQPFPNFTVQENMGKALFLAPPGGAGGAGCQGCHRAPEFDIDPNSLHNGVIGVANIPVITDLTNTRAPSLRDLVNPNGDLNGPLMHDGSLPTIQDVINHYDAIPAASNGPLLDPRLRPGGQPQNLGLTQNEKNALEAFLLTLTGSDLYTNEKWSDPFDDNGNLVIINGFLPIEWTSFEGIQDNERIRLDWTTATEQDNEGFFVMRSDDGQRWDEIAFVEGQGNSLDPTTYLYYDESPYPSLNYYQLKQMDLDGTETLSEIISVRFEIEVDLTIYPNPTSSQLTISTTENIEALRLYTVSGQIVLESVENGLNEFDLSTLPVGTYLAEIIINNKPVWEKIVVNR